MGKSKSTPATGSSSAPGPTEPKGKESLREWLLRMSREGRVEIVSGKDGGGFGIVGGLPPRRPRGK